MNNIRLLAKSGKEGGKSVLVVYPEKGFSKEADANYEADASSSPGSTTYMSDGSDSFSSTAKMAEDAMSGAECDRLVWAGDRKYARVQKRIDEIPQEEIEGIFSGAGGSSGAPAANAADEAKARVPLLVGAISACARDITHCSSVESVHALLDAIARHGAEIVSIVNGLGAPNRS